MGAANQRQQDRRRYADGCVGRQQANQGGGAGHQQDRHGQRAFAADAVAEHAENYPAQGAKGKGNREHGKGFEQCRAGVFTGEELLGDGGCEKAIYREIKPLDKVADRGRDNHFSQRFRADVPGCGAGHMSLDNGSVIDRLSGQP